MRIHGFGAMIKDANHEQPEDTISEIKGTPIMHEMPSPRPGHEIGHARQVGGLNELEGSPR